MDPGQHRRQYDPRQIVGLMERTGQKEHEHDLHKLRGLKCDPRYGVGNLGAVSDSSKNQDDAQRHDAERRIDPGQVL